MKVVELLLVVICSFGSGMPLPLVSRNTLMRAPGSAVPAITGWVLFVRLSPTVPVSVAAVRAAVNTADGLLSTTSARRVAEMALVLPAASVVRMPMLCVPSAKAVPR